MSVWQVSWSRVRRIKSKRIPRGHKIRTYKLTNIEKPVNRKMKPLSSRGGTHKHAKPKKPRRPRSHATYRKPLKPKYS
jgi:hypothetical protein